MKIRNKKIIAIITILVITIIYGIWKENRGKIKIENIILKMEECSRKKFIIVYDFRIFLFNMQNKHF